MLSIVFRLFCITSSRNDYWNTKEGSKMARMISKTTYITTKILANISWDGWIENHSLTKYYYKLFVVQHNLRCHQFPGMCSLNVSDFSYTIYGQSNDLHKKIKQTLSSDQMAMMAKMAFPFPWSSVGYSYIVMVTYICYTSHSSNAFNLRIYYSHNFVFRKEEM